MGAVRVGTCGFSIPPEDSFEAFDVVELPLAYFDASGLAAAHRLRSAAPSSFEFTVVAHRLVTGEGPRGATRRGHRCFADTPAVRRAWRSTLEIADALDASFVIVRCPSTFRPTDANIDRLARFFRWAHRGVRLGWEPRGAAWPDELVWELCRELSLTHVVHPCRRLSMRGRPPYYRFPGINGHRHRYTEAELASLRSALIAPVTYCLFGNATGGEDARRLATLAHR